MSSAPTPPTTPDQAPDEPAESVELVESAESADSYDLPDGFIAGVDDEVPTPARGDYALLTRLGTELIGTLALVLVVSGTALYSLVGFGSLGAALAGGMALAGLYAAFVHVSGAHLNPAVTLGSAIAGRTAPLDAVLYVVAQVIGAVAGVAAVFVTVPDKLASAVLTASATPSDLMARAANGWGTASPLYTASQGQVEFGLVAALVVETLGAAVLVGVVLANRPTARSALAVGATYGAVLLLASPITGGGFNPARSTAAALFTLGGSSPVMGQLWLFWVAPLLGGAMAGLVKLAFGVREQSFVVVEA